MSKATFIPRIADEWCFEKVAYPGREISWEEWRK